MTIINRVQRFSHELQSIGLKIWKAFRFSKARIEVVQFNYGMWKNRVFEKSCGLCSEGGFYVYLESTLENKPFYQHSSCKSNQSFFMFSFESVSTENVSKIIRKFLQKYKN